MALTLSDRVLAALSPLGTITEGATETCRFFEITNEATGAFITLDSRGINDLSDEYLATLAQYVALRIGTVP